MPDESGFEIARAFVAVAPDLGDFQDLLDEAIGGIIAHIRVVPDAADFQHAVDEETGGAVAAVRLLADGGDFQHSVDEETSGAVAAVRVLADAGSFQGSVDEETAGTVVGVRVVPDAAGFDAALSDLGDESVGIRVSANTSEATSEVAALVSDVNEAHAELTVGLDAGAARDQAEALAGELSSASAGITVGVATGGGVEDVAGQLDGVQGSASGAEAAISAVGGEMAVLSGTAETAAGSLAGVSAAVMQATGVVPDLASEVGNLTGGLEGLGAGFGAVISAHAGALSGLTAGLAGAFAGAAGAEVDARVVPDVSGFAEAAEAQLGDLAIGVRVVPETADFTQALDEEVGGAAVPVRVVPDVADFQAVLDEQVAGAVATVMVDADTGPAETSVRSFGTAAVEELREVSSAAQASGEALDEYWSQPRLLSGLPAQMQAAVDALNGVAAVAADDGDLIEADLAGVTAEAERLASQLDTVDADFLRFATGVGGDDFDELNENLAGVSGRLTDLHEGLADARGQLEYLAEQIGTAGGDFDGMDSRFGTLTGSLRTFGAALGGVAGELASMGGDWLAMDDQAARFGTTLDEVPAKIAAMDTVFAASADARAASLSKLNDDTESIGDAGEDAAGKLGPLGGVLDSLGERLGTMAVDPFMWMMAVPTIIDGVTDAVKALSGSQSDLYDTMSRQDDATGYNISGYQKLISQLTGVQGATLAAKDATSDAGAEFSVHTGVDAYASSLSQVHGAASQAETTLMSLGTHLGDLEGRYNITRAQAEALATAAGVSATQLSGSGSAAEEAMAKVEKYGDANLGATGPTAQLAGDMLTFGNDALTASSRVSALSDSYGLLVGNFLSTQGDALDVAQDFLALSSNAHEAGASMTGTNSQSVTLQQSYVAVGNAVLQTAEAMVTQKDSSQEVTSYINEQIDKLATLGGGSALATTAIEGLKQWEDQLTTSTQQQTEAADKAAQVLQDQFTNQVRSAGDTSHSTATEIGTLKTSILDTGTTSQQTADDRAQLISDLEQAGVNAKTATSMVDGFITKIGKIPSSTKWTLDETATGTWTESEVASSINLHATRSAADGGLIRGGSGRPKADDIIARLSDNEYVVQADAVDHYGTGLLDSINAMHFATGGLAALGGSYSGTVPGLADWATGQYDASASDLAAVLEGAATAGATASRSAAGAPAGAAAGVQALAREMAAAIGWTGAQWDALNSVEMAEAGWSLTATNPSSGAYGIAQFISGPSEYAQYGGDATTAQGQVTAFENYVRQRYGDPVPARAHEQQYHWYANGGHMSPGETGVVGDAGPELLTAGPSGATITPMQQNRAPVIVNFYGTQYPTNEQLANIKSEMALSMVAAP